MPKSPIVLAAMIAACPALAQVARELDAHEHGVSELNLAFAGSQIAIELHAPGFDIVGFEYVAESAEDLATVDAALAALGNPLDLFQFPEAAGCTVIEAEVELVQGEDEHDDHDDHGDEEHDAHDHDEHEEHGEHEEHADHDDHDHDESAEGGVHSEFEAEYLLTCTDVAAIDAVTMGFFDAFETAVELEVVVFTTSGAQTFEVERVEPVLDLSGAL